MAEDVKWRWMGVSQWSRTFEGKQTVVDTLFGGLTDSLGPSSRVIVHGIHGDGDVVVVEHSGRNELPDGRHYDNNYCWVFQFQGGLNYWWDLYIKDDTVNGPYYRGGGIEIGSTALGCCSSFGEWGLEAASGNGGNPVGLPTTDVDQLTYKPAGNANYYNWGASTAYPAGRPGTGSCWYAQNVDDNFDQGCGDGSLQMNSQFLAPFYYYRGFGF